MTTVTAEQVLRAGPARRPGDGTGVGPGLMVSRAWRRQWAAQWNRRRLRAEG
jgi:hypothetical protein